MTLVLITSDQIGSGDEVLGRKLMGNFLSKLSEEGDPVEVILVLLNRGVHLAAEGSEALDALRALEDRGARIRSCITCLEHYGLVERLAVGDIGTMAETVSTLAKAHKVVTL